MNFALMLDGLILLPSSMATIKPNLFTVGTFISVVKPIVNQNRMGKPNKPVVNQQLHWLPWLTDIYSQPVHQIEQ